MIEASGFSTSQGDKTPAQLCAERAARVDDAVHLRQPDRVPIFLMFGHLLADLAGITRQEMYENPAAAQIAFEDAVLRFQPDLVGRLPAGPGMSRALGDRMTKWPGYGLGPNDSFQYQEDEFMTVEDYDAFLSDPADWAMRVYLPRVFDELKPLSMLPPLGIMALGYFAMAQYLPLLEMPPMVAALQALTQGAHAQGKAVRETLASVQRMAELGFPPSPFFAGAHLSAPFDFVGDTLRGMKGLFLDLRRCPDKLLAAEERVIPIMLEAAIATCRVRHIPYAFIPLHRGSDGFISKAVFERFYWPQLKSVILSLVAENITPVILWEGTWDQRLHYLTQLPAGKTIGMFQSSDLFKVKEVLGETMCIVGGMPVTMLVGSTPAEIREFTRKLCQVVGRNGGFIMSTDIGEMEGSDPELIQVWVDATSEFGELR